MTAVSAYGAAAPGHDGYPGAARKGTSAALYTTSPTSSASRKRSVDNVDENLEPDDASNHGQGSWGQRGPGGVQRVQLCHVAFRSTLKACGDVSTATLDVPTGASC